MKIMERKETALELYVNYDCSMDNICIMEMIVDLLNRIIEGLYYHIYIDLNKFILETRILDID